MTGAKKTAATKSARKSSTKVAAEKSGAKITTPTAKTNAADTTAARTTAAETVGPATVPLSMPAYRPSRAVVEAVRPVVDGGRWPAKASIDRPLTVLADVFTDGHDLVSGAVLTRRVGDAEWSETPMDTLVNDRHRAVIVPDRLGRMEYDVIGWIAHTDTWRQGTVKKIDAGLDVSVELEIGRRLVQEILTTPLPDAPADDLDRLATLVARLTAADTDGLDDDDWSTIFFRCEPRDPIARFDAPLVVDVDPMIATTGSWYSFFPRSTVGERVEAGSLRDAIDRLDYVASMGFDVAYIPPVHPIGNTNRKGRNNATLADADDVGSPYAIGSHDGGHMSIAPELGTLDDFDDLVAACRERDMQLAIDVAFNCSPDHPWVSEHPDWFTTRPDGSIQYAENPPKKYEDIYPLDFESPDWQGLWSALADVFRFWIEHGVTLFRVDNPHTKSFAFWEWAIGDIRRDHPEVVFLSEAFTRPRVMERLAKIGFNQSYTYFAWRQTAYELREYFTDLSTRTLDYFRPAAWPNTHDILTPQLQHGGRPAFVMRAVLAATLSPTWGVYGPVYELLESVPRDGVEDYGDSEKYEVRRWDLDRDDSLAPLLTRLNAIRREQPAFDTLETLRFHNTDNDALLCFTKTDPGGAGDPVLVVVNLDPYAVQAGHVDIDLAAIGLAYGSAYDVVDRLGGVTYRWQGNRNFVELSPWGAMAHVFTVRADEHPPTSHDEITKENS